MDKAKLQRLREAAEKSRPGPWYARGQFVSLRPDNTGMGGTLHTNHVATCVDRDEAAFIAKCDPTIVLGLLKRIEQLEADAKSSYNAHVHSLRCINDALRALPNDHPACNILLRPMDCDDDCEPPLL